MLPDPEQSGLRSSEHMKRRERANEARFITFSCFHRLPLLNSDRTRGWMADAVIASRQRFGFHLWAYVFMPEHVHLVLYPTRMPIEIGAALAFMKQSVSRRAVAWLRREAPDWIKRLTDSQPNGRSTVRFWQRGGGYDRNMTSPTLVHEAMAYIHRNPVERGLCAGELDWKWSSAAAWTLGTDEPISIDRELVPRVTVVR